MLKKKNQKHFISKDLLFLNISEQAEYTGGGNSNRTNKPTKSPQHQNIDSDS